MKPEEANPVDRFLIRLYRPVIHLVLRRRWAVIGGAMAVLALTVVPWKQLGSEFMPPLNEGSVMDMPSMFPGIGTAQAKQVLQQRDAAIMGIPEVEMVLGKVGRAKTATDMAPMSMIESIAILKPEEEWRPGVTFDSIQAEMNAAVKTPGVANMWSMPIKNRLDMLATGIKTPVGIKIFGPDLATLDRIGKQIEGAKLSQHRQMVANMISQMSREMRDMDMSADADWNGTVDAVREDLRRLPEMSAQELEGFMPDHRQRVMRLLDMHRDMMGNMKM